MVALALTATRKKGVAIAAMAVGAFMLVDVVYQINMHMKWRGWLAQPMTSACPSTQPADDAKEKKAAKHPEIHAAIRKRNVFTKVKPTGHGMSLTGVLGGIALFKSRDGKIVGIEEGKSGSGIKVVSIKDYEVTIEHKGKTETMRLFPKSKR